MTANPATALLDELALLDPTHPPTTRQARELCRKAKAINRIDVLPAWLIPLTRRDRVPPPCTPTPPRAHAAVTATTLGSEDSVLKAKSESSGVPVPVLRTVLKRGLCEASTKDLPIDPYEYAQARVNSFIRLYQGDCQAREDDADLLRVAS